MACFFSKTSLHRSVLAYIELRRTENDSIIASVSIRTLRYISDTLGFSFFLSLYCLQRSYREQMGEHLPTSKVCLRRAEKHEV